jgi:hypothetical protein
MSQPLSTSTAVSDAAAPLLRRIARRVNFGVFVSAAAVPVEAVIIVFAVAFLFSRMLAPEYSRYTFWVLAALPVGPVWAWLRCRRKGLFYNEKDVVELVDHLSASDGLASTAYERPTLTGGRRAWDAIASHLDTHALRLNPSWFA